MMMELNRISSHLVALATGGMELGALTAMEFGFRERELVLDIFEMVSGLRMNSAYIRPGGVAQDLPEDGVQKIRDTIPLLRRRLKDTADLLVGNSIWMGRTVGVGYLDLTGCMALGITGPVLRSTGLPHDLRKSQPYCGYENYEFDVCTETTSRRVRPLPHPHQRDGAVAADRRAVPRPHQARPGDDRGQEDRVARASCRSARDGQGNSPEHIKEIMSESMEALIHHFKLVTEGFRVPAGQVYTAVESPEGRARLPHRQRRRHPAVPRALPRPLVQQPPVRGGHVRGQHDLRRHRRGRQHRPGHGRRGPLGIQRAKRRHDDGNQREHPRAAAAARCALPASAVRPHAHAAPGAEPRGRGDPGRHRRMRRGRGRERRRGDRRRVLLHDVQAAPGRRAPHRRVRQHRLRPARRRRRVRRAERAARCRPRLARRTTASSGSSASSARPPARTLRS